MEVWVQAISTIGFPIVVAMYSLTRLERTVRENTTIITKLYERLDKDDKDDKDDKERID